MLEVRTDPLWQFRQLAHMTDRRLLELQFAARRCLARHLQREVVAAQAREYLDRRTRCGVCGARCRVKDCRTRRIDTAFGRVAVCLPRFCCAWWWKTMTGEDWPSHCRSTPELDRLRAYLSALMSYRSAAAVLKALLPVDDGGRPETLRNHALGAGAELQHLPLPTQERCSRFRA